MLDGVVMAMILVITVITQDWHKLDEDKFDADRPPIIRNWRQHKTQNTIPHTKCIIRVSLRWCDIAGVTEGLF